NTILYLSSRSNSDVPDNFKQIINTFSAGLFSASHTTFSSIFSFSDVNNYPQFNIARKGFRGMNILDLITFGLTLYNSETSLLVNDAQFDKLFGEDKFIADVRAIADIFIKSIPQLVTQALYFHLIVTYSVIPFFTLCTTAFMILLSSLQAILKFCKKDEKANDN
ncbi:17538_t:CDS:2, partial [Gigaspora rosea]